MPDKIRLGNDSAAGGVMARVWGGGRWLGLPGAGFLLPFHFVPFRSIFGVLALGMGFEMALLGAEMGGIVPFLFHFSAVLGRFGAFWDSGLGWFSRSGRGVGCAWRGGTPPPNPPSEVGRICVLGRCGGRGFGGGSLGLLLWVGWVICSIIKGGAGGWQGGGVVIGIGRRSWLGGWRKLGGGTGFP